MLPAPITSDSSIPSEATSLTSRVIAASASRSMPEPWAGASASPESLSNTRRNPRLLPDPRSAVIFAEQVANGTVGIAHPRLLFEDDIAVEFLQFALDYFIDDLFGLACRL